MTDLTFKKLREVSESRTTAWMKDGLQSWRPAEWVVAMVGELGEACNVLKKMNRLRDGITGNRKSVDMTRELLQAQLGEELADTMIYLELLSNSLGVDLEKEVVKKFNKVSEELGFSERL